MGSRVCRADAEGGRRCSHHQKGSNLARHNERRRRNREIKAGIAQWARLNGVDSAQVAELQQMGPRAAKNWAQERGINPDQLGSWVMEEWVTPELCVHILTTLGRQGGHADERRLLEGTIAFSSPTSDGTNTTNRIGLDNDQVGYHKAFAGLDNDMASDFGQSSALQPIHEVAAWQLAKRLGPPWDELVPPCVLREVDGELGSFALERPGLQEGGAGRSPVWEAAAFYDSLIGQQDRHRGNLLMDGPRMTLIDHGYTFAKAGDELNQSGLQVARTSLLTDVELEGLQRLLDSPDSLGLEGMLETERLEALRSRARRMRGGHRILQPGTY